jgi:hypothetical protein
MSEIKFACPHCGQHIACDRDYVDMSIVCPSCGQPMDVPRLSATEASHPELLVVASAPRPKRQVSSRIPTIDLWTEAEWDERYRAASAPSQQIPVWLLTALGTLIAAVLFKASGGVPGWVVIACVILGTIVTCIFVARQPTLDRKTGAAVSVVFYVLVVIVAIPVAAIGVIFIGCACAAA